MKPEELLNILSVCAKLKTELRHCWSTDTRQESVADHSWRLALMAMLIRNEKEFEDADMDRVIRMCLIHDLGEAFTGDIPVFLKKTADAEKEDDILSSWVSGFSEPDRSQWLQLLDEMKKLETKEAMIYKALDRLEALISHNESDISSWLPLEYDLQLTYGQENMRFSEYFTDLRKEVDEWSLRKIREESPEK